MLTITINILIKSICMKSSHHDPIKAPLDLAFFSLAETEFGFKTEKIHEESRPSYPFVENDGMDSKRGMVYVYTLKLRK